MVSNQNSHFALNPHANIKRSRMNIPKNIKTTFSAADIVPFYCAEVLPGDSFSIDTSVLARMQTLITPLMDDIYLDMYYFYVPNRLLWKHWEAFCGQSDEPWFDDVQYTIPQIEVDIAKGSSTAMSVGSKTVADYLGMPLPADGEFTASYTDKFTHLPFRCYVKIWNDWFRNENLQGLAAFNTEDADVQMNNDGDAFYGGKLLKANRFKDIFSSCLPSPQKGPSVTIGIGDVAPVFAAPVNNTRDQLKHGSESLSTLNFIGKDSEVGSSVNYANLWATAVTPTEGEKYMRSSGSTLSSAPTGSTLLSPANLMADISAATGISINELRMAFATQRFYERQARSGSRYIEILASQFGVQSPDARLQRSEFLGGNRIAININQAVQQSETATTPLGNVGAYSLTTDHQHSFDKSFVEHGYVMGLMVARRIHSYQNGYEKMWQRKDKFDMYWPEFANIGEQPLENITIFADGSSTDHEVFGYNEAWAEYRYQTNLITGEFRSNYSQSLDFWHLADDYDSTPRLSAEWDMEDAETIDRAIAVSARVADQFMADIYVNNKATRPMPLFSVPGLLDH